MDNTGYPSPTGHFPKKKQRSHLVVGGQSGDSMNFLNDGSKVTGLITNWLVRKTGGAVIASCHYVATNITIGLSVVFFI